MRCEDCGGRLENGLCPVCDFVLTDEQLEELHMDSPEMVPPTEEELEDWYEYQQGNWPDTEGFEGDEEYAT